MDARLLFWGYKLTSRHGKHAYDVSYCTYVRVETGISISSGCHKSNTKQSINQCLFSPLVCKYCGACLTTVSVVAGDLSKFDWTFLRKSPVHIQYSDPDIHFTLLCAVSGFSPETWSVKHTLRVATRRQVGWCSRDKLVKWSCGLFRISGRHPRAF